MKRAGWISLLLIIILPRLIRMTCPLVQIEDPNYIYGAYLITLGQQPFFDFAQPNPPLLEGLLSGLYLLFTVSHRVPEALSNIAYILTALLIYKLGEQWFSTAAGWWSGVLYSTHYLLFRYHLFEREIYATLAIAAGLVLLSTRGGKASVSIPAGLAFGLGFACKQTALVPFLAVLAVIVVFRRDVKTGLRFAFGFAGSVGILTGLYSALYGPAYLRQTFWFHFIKGAVAPWQVKTGWTMAGLGYLGLLAASSVALFRPKLKSGEWIAAAMISADIVFFWFVSGAFWPHYLLSTLLPVSLLAGWTVTSFRIQHRISNPGRAAAALVVLGLLVSLTAWHHPGYLWGEGAADRFGFSGTSRKTVAACAAFIGRHTAPDDLIISDPFIALEARRRKVVKFKDNWGLILWMNDLFREGRYRDGLKQMGNTAFARIRQESQKYWVPTVKDALEKGTVGAVQPNYEFPVRPETLRQYGFKEGIRLDGYEIWIRDSSIKIP